MKQFKGFSIQAIYTHMVTSDHCFLLQFQFLKDCNGWEFFERRPHWCDWSFINCFVIIYPFLFQ